jgi:UDP-GlcNAc:undecaprenyl-phosphate GlcNAc-1-phosphate transferase
MIVMFFTALVLSALLLLVLMPVAYRLKLLAVPGEHRLHESSTPLTGGIAIFLALLITSSVFSLAIPWSLLSAMTLVFIFGIVDDRWTVPFWARFVVQIFAALLLVQDGVILNDLGHLVSEELVSLGRWQTALTVFSIVGVINAVNMIDGLDGLVGLIIFVAIVCVVYLLPPLPNVNEILICLVVLGSISGFLVFNLRLFGNRPARVFMGDAGSMFLGVFLSWLLVRYSQNPTLYFPPVLALWILLVPLFDTVGVMLRRIFHGHSPFHADRWHTHHLLEKMGLSVNQTLTVIISISVISGVFGITGLRSGLTESTLFFLFLGLFVLYVVGMEIGQHGLRK